MRVIYKTGRIGGASRAGRVDDRIAAAGESGADRAGDGAVKFAREGRDRRAGADGRDLVGHIFCHWSTAQKSEMCLIPLVQITLPG